MADDAVTDDALLRVIEQQEGPAPCAQCEGVTIKFRWSGLDLQFWICPRISEPGHLSWAEVDARWRAKRSANSRRWA